MAVSSILDTFAAATAITISLGGLVSSTAGVGRQGTIVDNTTNRYTRIQLWVKLTQGTTPTSNKGASIYLIRDDNNSNRTDGAGTTDAGITIVNAPLIGVLRNKAAAATGDVLQDHFMIYNPGPKWTVAIVHDTVAALNATGSNHVVSFVGENDQAQ